jgi:tetratricopeptide (TPR) repeat protein
MKVFISSTYNDLIEYRKAAHDALEKLGLQVICMEAFGARPEDSISACLKEVEESDLFVGIYAHRYGYIPKDATTSITEQEFNHAQELGKPIFGFVVDDDFIWHQKYFEHDKKTSLDALLAKVKTQPVEFFTSPDNLAQKIASSVGRYIAEEKLKAEKAIQVTIGGSVSGNFTIGDHNTSNSSIGNFQSPKPTGNTLPTQPYFFGRETELNTIAEALSHESRTWGALIDGPGGIGKTALAIRAAYLAPINLFERKIFITAKVRELTPEGEKPLKDFSRDNYFSMLDELALELGEDGIPRLAPNERANQLRMALGGKKTLIVFDNLETLQEGERDRLFQFLSRLPEGNKAIATSRRRRSDVDARAIRLDRLSADEALQLMNELAKNNSRLARENEAARRKLYEITNGSPLLIKWVCGQLGRDRSAMHTIEEACAFIEKAPEGNDPLEHSFGDLLETFTESETKVLAALTHFTQPAKLKWLSQMTDLPESTAQTALEDLADRSILIANNESSTFYLPPLAAQFIRTRRPEAVIQTGDALTDRAYALTLQYGGGSEDYEKFPMLEAEWDFVSAALPRLLTGDNDRLQTVCDQLFQFLGFTGRWDDRIWLFEQAEERALAANDKENAGLRAYNAGYTYYIRNQPGEVLVYSARAAEHLQDSTPINKARAIQLRGGGYELQKNYSSAITAYREALQILHSIPPEDEVISIVLNDLARAELNNNDYISAERDYREALRIAKKRNFQVGIAEITGSLAKLALDREQWAEAESLAREALALAEKVGRQELIASDCHRLAKALLKQNKNLDEALSLSRRAVEIFTRLRQQNNLQEAQETLAEIEEKIKENRD